jgi:replicative DNA helicase
MMAKFVRLTKGLADKGILISPEEIQKHVQNPLIDHYASCYYYNDEHFKQFQQTGSIEGIVDVKTDKIWWDFDSKDNLKAAKEDTIELIHRLIAIGIQQSCIEVYFSGSKGFNVILNLNREITPKQVKHIALNVFGKGLKTLDASLYNPSRILRIPGTKHQNTDYYKTQLSFFELKGLKKEELFMMSSNPRPTVKAPKLNLNEELFKIEETPETKNEVELQKEFDITTKPRGWKATKWALMQGFFKSGERDTSMMILAATCKSMGYDKVTSYYMCKSALQKSWERHGKGDFSKEDLWKKIEQVYADSWKGGSYSEKEDAFLQKKAEEQGIKELTSSSTVDIKGALRIYKDYAKNINRLTLKTGIAELDRKQRITVGMAFGIVASPGSGKTTLALTMLHSMSKAGELCIFFSYDMYAPLIVQKIIQKHWTKSDDIDEVFKQYEAGNQEYVAEVEALIAQEYPNVEFCFETGQTIEDIYKTIRDAEQKKGMKCKFIVVDYNELVISDVGDPTQSSNKTAQEIRSLAQKEQLCVLSLFQPSKVNGDPAQEIMSYRAAKGGSGIEQSLRLMLGVSRPGYDPNNPSNDKFLNLKVLKNNMGQIFSVDLHWDGYKGLVRSLSADEKYQLHELRTAKDAEKKGNEEW